MNTLPVYGPQLPRVLVKPKLEKKDKFIMGVMIIIGMGALFAQGWFANDFFKEKKYERKLDGFFIQNVTKTSVENYRNIRDPRGDWVCINTYGMDYNRCQEVASHECGHELFAEMCESDNEICKQAQKLLNDNVVK